MINYLLSGMDMKLGFYPKQKEYLKKDIKDNSVIAFIASTFSDIENSKTFANELLNDFKNIGIIFKQSYVITKEISIEKAKQYIDKSDVVFIMGGDTLEQIKNINEYGIITNLQNRKGITIGISAGSINMATNVALARDIYDNIPNHSFYKGIGLVDINIEPHFDLNNTFHNKDIIEISKDNKIICLSDESFIRVEDNNVEIIGDYYIFEEYGITYNDIKISLLEDKEENYKLLHEWCSQEEIYKYFEQRILTYDEIVNKYKNRCSINSNTPTFMIYYKNEKVGIIQYSEKSNVFDIDIYIGNTNFHNKSIGSKAIILFTQYLKNIKGAKEFTLIPLKENIKAVNCYKKSGYKVIKEFKKMDTIGEEKEYVLLKYEEV